MTVIKIDDDLHKEVGKIIKEGDKIEYPSIKNFIDKAIKEKLVKHKKKLKNNTTERIEQAMDGKETS